MANTPAPVDKTAAVTPAADTNSAVVNASSARPIDPNESAATTSTNTATATTSSVTELGAPTPTRLSSDSNSLSQFLNTASLPMILGTLLLLGIGLAFTPCVFPMMPILTSLIAGEDKKTLTPMRGFKLSLVYVLGMALVYALLGSLMGALGARANVAIWLQKPVVIIASAALFVALALSMFGLFGLQLPATLQNRLNQLSNQQKGGRMTGAFVMGAISALVVSPCVSAPLVGVLGFISTTGQAAMGAVALFALGLGMGIPLIVLGTTGGKFLPKAGVWMNAVKGFFGVGLLAVAIGSLERIFATDIEHGVVGDVVRRHGGVDGRVCAGTHAGGAGIQSTLFAGVRLRDSPAHRCVVGANQSAQTFGWIFVCSRQYAGSKQQRGCAIQNH